MSPEPDQKRPAFVRHPIAWIKWWLPEAPTNLGSALIALATIFIASLLTILGGILINFVGPTGNIPGYVAVIVGGACLAVGLATAWALTRQYYELRLVTQTVELELAEEKLSALEPSDGVLRRFIIYSEHVYALAENMISGAVTLQDLTSDDVKESICGLTQTYLAKATNAPCKISIWCEPSSETRINRLSERFSGAVPGSMSNLVPGKVKFEILAAPDHTSTEREDFEVPIDPSWLKHNQRYADTHDEQKAYAEQEPHMDSVRGDDMEAFVKHDYESVRAVSFERDNMIGYLVAVSTERHAFSPAEDQYLLWLKRILELDGLLGDGSVQLAPGT